MANKRKFIQFVSAFITNSYIGGFINGTIYRGRLKNICVPGLNCYSCPGALGSCPIGSLQAVLGAAKYQMTYYVVGLLILFGTIAGRLICGFLCPFGLVQELLYKIRSFKLQWNKRNSWLRYIKYIVLVVFVILIPLYVVDYSGLGTPAFCKFICPAGTLEAGIPLVAGNPPLQALAGALFNWKVSLLIITIIASIFIFRPFCYVVCPLGAIYALFNKFSFYRMEVNKHACISCQACSRTCKMNVKITEHANSSDCIRCGECVSVCPTGAITAGFSSIKSIKEGSIT